MKSNNNIDLKLLFLIVIALIFEYKTQFYGNQVLLLQAN